MTLSMKLGGAWKEAQSLHVKINGEWKDISTLYSKKDGAWVTVYSSGALITFTNYPYPIPVAAGWKYSTDKTNWTTVETDGTINNSGTFTGWVKAKDLVLNEFCTTFTAESSGKEMGNLISTGRQGLTSFVNGSKGYVCGGRYDDVEGYGYPIYCNTVNVYDISGIRSSGTSLSENKGLMVSFVNGSKGYVCGGYNGDSKCSSVEVYDESGNRSIGTSLGVARSSSSAFVINSKGYVCGGDNSPTDIDSPYVDIYDISGNRTTGVSLTYGRRDHTSFVNDSKGYVCGGDGGYKYVEVYFNIPEVVSTKIPITEGSTYTLNGTTATATGSQILSFDKKVSGTITYKTGTVPSS